MKMILRKKKFTVATTSSKPKNIILVHFYDLKLNYQQTELTNKGRNFSFSSFSSISSTACCTRACAASAILKCYAFSDAARNKPMREQHLETIKKNTKSENIKEEIKYIKARKK